MNARGLSDARKIPDEVMNDLRRYRAHGEAALDTRTAPGALRMIPWAMDGWLRKTVGSIMNSSQFSV